MIVKDQKIKLSKHGNFFKFQGMFLRLFILFFVSSDLFQGIYGLLQKQKIPATELAVINHELCRSCSRWASSLKDAHTYSELKYAPQTSLPSAFTICVSLLVTIDNPDTPSLFTLLGNDRQPWFSASVR